MFRLYFWVTGAPAKRVGGPWWYRDFSTREERCGFLSEIESSLIRYADIEGDLPMHAHTAIAPPEDTQIYVNAATQGSVPEWVPDKGGK